MVQGSGVGFSSSIGLHFILKMRKLGAGNSRSKMKGRLLNGDSRIRVCGGREEVGRLPWDLAPHCELGVGGKNRTPHLGSGHGGREEQC